MSAKHRGVLSHSVLTTYVLHIGNIYVTVRSDDEGGGCHFLDFALETVGYTVEEIEHLTDRYLVECVYVEHYGTARDEVVRYVGYLLIGLGTYYLELDTWGAILCLRLCGCCLAYRRCGELLSLCLIVGLEFHIVISFTLAVVVGEELVKNAFHI